MNLNKLDPNIRAIFVGLTSFIVVFTLTAWSIQWMYNWLLADMFVPTITFKQVVGLLAIYKMVRWI